jgi:imidazolonepropionase-like amidohydrolase
LLAVPVGYSSIRGKESLNQSEKQPVALVGGNVISMEREEVLSNYTVVILSGKIAAVGPAATTQAPKNAIRIDARGNMLCPVSSIP